MAHHQGNAAQVFRRICWKVTTGAALTLSAFLCGCSGNQSALNPKSTQSSQVFDLWWLYCIVLTAIYALVLLFFILALTRRHPEQTLEPILEPDPKRERRMGIAVGSSVGVTAIILFVFLIADFTTGRILHDQPDPHPLKIEITGHQWWWEVRYDNDISSNIIQTANEIHVPVGKTVEFELRSADVIHSFWAPNFNGKKDLVPGHPTIVQFRATQPGNFRGQCAEYCGVQHAHMRFVVVAEPEDKFAAWYKSQQQSAPEPADDFQKRGREIFVTTTCILCHTVQGTPARGTVGPDLTHVASRYMLAAGAMTNNLGHLAGWIVDPQKIKPGVLMPQNNLSPQDLRALLAYLETLK
jgi:cytochrome c oxidase subunit II